MSFISTSFLIFFAIVFAFYHSVNRHWQNRLLLLASYVFYGSWDWRFIPLLFAATWISFFSAIRITASKTREEKKRYLSATLILELGLLAVFKYFNFFSENVIQLLQTLGVHADPFPVKILIPLGISYYTFQAISYVIDVYRGKTVATDDFVAFALFKSFFPILFSGPIERAGNLLAQVQENRVVRSSHLAQGLYLVSWGLFKKVYVSDHIAPTVDQLFDQHATIGGPGAWIAAYAFTLQIYCDFSGYTDIARGLAKFLGFDLVLNFNLPLFARNPVDFWRRWHMSLSNWFGDYLYEPLFFRTKNIYIALFFTFFLNGLWHGARWNFVILGAYNGLILVSYVFLRPFLRPLLEMKSRYWEILVAVVSTLLMFHVTVLGFVLFRSDSLIQIRNMLSHMFTGPNLITDQFRANAIGLLFFAAPILLLEAIQLKTRDLDFFLKLNPKIQFATSLAALYLTLLVYLFTTGANNGGHEFIYFQF